MADFSPFAPKPLDLSGVAALLGPTGGEAGFIRQAEGRRVNLQPLMNQEMGQRDATLQQVYGSNESDNALKAIMMQAALGDSARGQDADIVKAIAPALINHGESSQVGNLGLANENMIDPDMFFKQAGPHDAMQMAKDAANQFLMTQQGNAAPVNANANMIAAEAQRTRAAKANGIKYTVTDQGLPEPVISGSSGNAGDLGGIISTIQAQRNANGNSSDPTTVDYGNTGQNQGLFVTGITKHGGMIAGIEKDYQGSNKDRVTVIFPNNTQGHYLIGQEPGDVTDLDDQQDDNAE